MELSLETRRLLESEAKGILSWLLSGVKQGAKADGHAEPLPETSIQPPYQTVRQNTRKNGHR